MDNWWESAIMRQQVVQILVAGGGLLGYVLDAGFINEKLLAIGAAVSAAIALKTMFSRLFRPSPNLTVTANQKEIELRNKGVIK